MSRLTIYADTDPSRVISSFTTYEEITAALAPLGLRFERWNSPVELPLDATSDEILAAYAPYLDELMGATGAGSADVIQLSPDSPAAEGLRAKFLLEHTHTEDEIRFFVRGSGNFIVHINDRIYDVFCVAGDLISVPAGTKHWFDASTRPSFTALRIFTDTSGWIAHYTGDKVHERFPATTG